jgi:hypothetical protein
MSDSSGGKFEVEIEKDIIKYFFLKNLQHETFFDMVPAQPSEIFMNTIPPSFCGRWRIILYGEFFVKGKKFKNCHRFYADMYDI